MIYDLNKLSLTAFMDNVRKDFSEHIIIYRQHFGLLPDYLDRLKTGYKKTTIRYKPNALDCPSNKCLNVFENNLHNNQKRLYVGKLIIHKIEIKKYGSLNNHDALNDGFTFKFILNKALSKIYGHIPNNALVTIYWINFLPND